ncbi:MAG TPA: universal stress protein [Longimicrobium sp.]|nr:universal stress protein [Longimicrobium sp.]
MWLLRLRSVLVATDLGPASEPALRTGARLAALAGAEFHLLHATDTPVSGGAGRLEEQLRLTAPEASAPASVCIDSGDAASAIMRRADRVAADAIVLGPHRRAHAGGEMGSTAASVVRGARSPCLVAATELRLPLQRVLVPIDLSETAEGALSVTLSWASALRPRDGTVEVVALHVTPDPADPAVIRAVHDEAARARTRAGGAAYVEIREVIAPGADPAAEILRRLGEQPVDLVVMGTRGSAGAESGFGSVSAAVARSTADPLLLVPAVAWEPRTGERPRG